MTCLPQEARLHSHLHSGVTRATASLMLQLTLMFVSICRLFGLCSSFLGTLWDIPSHVTLHILYFMYILGTAFYLCND